MLKKSIGLLVLIGIIATGCSTVDYFGKSSKKEMLEFHLEKQVGSTQIKNDSIFVKVPEDVYLIIRSDLRATNIKVSDYATVSPEPGEKQDFSQPVQYTVSAEDGSTKIYYVEVKPGGASDQQVPNSHFNLWHEVSNGEKKYFEIGKDTYDKTWATGNEGVAYAISLGSNAGYPTMPIETAPNQYAAELTTQNVGPLAASFGGKGIAAGNIFLGQFEIGNVTNAHPVFGYPYSQTPKAFQVDYKYMPAKGLLNGKLKPVDGTDKLDMYLIIEKREGGKVKRLGVAWFRSGETQTEWETIEKEIIYAYGQAPEGLEDYQKRVLKYGVDGNIQVTDPNQMPEATWGDITIDTPTHFFVSFTSSYQGDYFIGAPGSKLIVDNFKLIY